MKRYTVFAIVRRFLKAHGIVTRKTTHKSQEDPATKADTARQFLASTIPLLHQPNRDKAFIINMDQTPYNPHDTGNSTLAERGSRTVTTKEVVTSIGRITACLAVCADGTKLPPLLVYKGSPGGSVSRELSSPPVTWYTARAVASSSSPFRNCTALIRTTTSGKSTAQQTGCFSQDLPVSEAPIPTTSMVIPLGCHAMVGQKAVEKG